MSTACFSIIKVFVAGRNRLYELTSDLNIVTTVDTSPQISSDNCDEFECHSDYINKVLLIDHSTNRLITCGTSFQGACSIRNIQNISLPEQNFTRGIVGENEGDLCDERNLTVC